MWIDNEERNNLVKQNQVFLRWLQRTFWWNQTRFLYVPMWNKLSLLGRNWMFLHRHAPCHHNWVTNSESSLSHEPGLVAHHQQTSIGCHCLNISYLTVEEGLVERIRQDRRVYLEAADKIHPGTQVYYSQFSGRQVSVVQLILLASIMFTMISCSQASTLKPLPRPPCFWHSPWKISSTTFSSWRWCYVPRSAVLNYSLEFGF